MDRSYLNASPEEKIRMRQQAAQLRNKRAIATAMTPGIGVMADPFVVNTTPDWSPRQPAQQNTGYEVVDAGVPQPSAPATPMGAVSAPPQQVASQAPTGQATDADMAYMQSYADSIGTLGGLEDEQALLAAQDARAQEEEALAQAMIDAEMPEGRDSGRVYTAANPLEFLGTALRQYKGHKARKEASGKRDKYEESISDIGKRRKTERNKFGSLFGRILRGDDPDQEAWGDPGNYK